MRPRRAEAYVPTGFRSIAGPLALVDRWKDVPGFLVRLEARRPFYFRLRRRRNDVSLAHVFVAAVTSLFLHFFNAIKEGAFGGFYEAPAPPHPDGFDYYPYERWNPEREEPRYQGNTTWTYMDQNVALTTTPVVLSQVPGSSFWLTVHFLFTLCYSVPRLSFAVEVVALSLTAILPRGVAPAQRTRFPRNLVLTLLLGAVGFGLSLLGAHFRSASGSGIKAHYETRCFDDGGMLISAGQCDRLRNDYDGYGDPSDRGQVIEKQHLLGYFPNPDNPLTTVSLFANVVYYAAFVVTMAALVPLAASTKINAGGETFFAFVRRLGAGGAGGLATARFVLTVFAIVVGALVALTTPLLAFVDASELRVDEFLVFVGLTLLVMIVGGIAQCVSHGSNAARFPWCPPMGDDTRGVRIDEKTGDAAEMERMYSS